jgi:hypothetical protein
VVSYLLRARDVTGVEIRMTRECWAEHIVVRGYDKKRDVLYVSVGHPQDAISREVQPGIFVHLHPRTRKVVGYTLLDFQRRASRTARKAKAPAFAIPVQASFRLSPTTYRRRTAAS